MNSASSDRPSFPLLRMLTLVVLVSAALCMARRTTGFASWVELPVYDLATWLVWPWEAGHPDIRLLTYRQKELDDLGVSWPLEDHVLASVLERLLAANPSVVGVDKDRGRTEGSGQDLLRRIGMDHRVVWVAAAPTENIPEGIAPPPFLQDLPPDFQMIRIASPTFTKDPGPHPVVRKSAILSEPQRYSLPAMLALRHAISREPERADELREALRALGLLSGSAGGYWLKNDLGKIGQADEFLLKPVPHAAEALPVTSFAEFMAMNETELKNRFAGKLVLFGTHDLSTSPDEHSVVGDPWLRGIKLQGLATAQLLRELEGEPKIRFLADWQEDAGVVLASLAAVALLAIPRYGSTTRGVLAVLLPPVLVFCVAAIALKNGVWVPAGAPMFAAGLTGAGGVLFLWRRDSRERSAYFQVMATHLGPEVTQRVLARNELLVAGMSSPPETFEATAFFADLRGYSGISQKFEELGDTDDFFRWLNGFLRPAVELAARHGGFVKQFAGDGIFLIFGFPPEDGGDHARRAVACARDFAELVPRLNRGLSAELPPYHLRIGIYTGRIHADVIGGARHRDFSFFGPTINKAARLEGLRKDKFHPEVRPVRILISSATREHLSESEGSTATRFEDGPTQLDPRLPPEQVWEIKD